MHKLLIDERTQGIHARWCMKQLLVDETDKEIHTRWCTKQLYITEANEALPIPEDVQNNR